MPARLIVFYQTFDLHFQVVDYSAVPLISMCYFVTIIVLFKTFIYK